MPSWTQLSRSHDYLWLIDRWKRLAKSSGLKMVQYGEASGYPLYYVENAEVQKPGPAVYVSAGIHGDESAGPEALLAWTARHARRLRSRELLLFPCLNPWGLVQNSRFDSEGRDLNRTYHTDKPPQTKLHRALLKNRRFDVAVMLHEDYDARGTYIYEIRGNLPHWGEQLIAESLIHIRAETRREIEGRPARKGIVRRPVDPAAMPEHPEAFIMHFHHAKRAFTVETPSELAITDRVAAQIAILDAILKLAEKEFTL